MRDFEAYRLELGFIQQDRERLKRMIIRAARAGELKRMKKVFLLILRHNRSRTIALQGHTPYHQKCESDINKVLVGARILCQLSAR